MEPALQEIPTLETRVCPCGCGIEFRCLPNSEQIYANSRHDPDFDPRESRKIREGQIRRRRWEAKQRGKAIVKAVEDRTPEPAPEPQPEPVRFTPPEPTGDDMSPDTTGLLNNKEMAEELGIHFTTFSRYVSKGIVSTRVEGRQRWDPDKVRRQIEKNGYNVEPSEPKPKPKPEQPPELTETKSLVIQDDDSPQAIRFNAKREYLRMMVGHAQQAQEDGDMKRENEFLWIIVKDANLLDNS
jgi:hypothetical protein